MRDAEDLLAIISIWGEIAAILLLSGWLGGRPGQARPGAVQLNMTGNAERARGRQEIGSRLWGEETTNKNLVIAFGSFLIIQPGNSMTFWLGMWHDMTTCEHLLLPHKISIKILTSAEDMNQLLVLKKFVGKTNCHWKVFPTFS